MLNPKKTLNSVGSVMGMNKICNQLQPWVKFLEGRIIMAYINNFPIGCLEQYLVFK